MSDQFAPGSPEDDSAWTGGTPTGGVTPARGDAAGALAATGPPSSSASPTDGGPSSPYAPGAAGSTGSGGTGAKAPRRRKARAARRRAEGRETGRTGKGRSGGTLTRKGRTPGTSTGSGTAVRGWTWVWIVLGIVLLLSLLRACAGSSDHADPGGARGSGSTTAPTANSVDPTPAPSVSALRGVPLEDVPAPELVSATDLPDGVGFSPSSPAPGREVGVRFHDRYVGRGLVLTLSSLSTDDSSVPSYYRNDFYPDEVLRSVKVHIAPEGYGEGDYAEEPRLRLQGESGHWYGGECFEYGFDDWLPTTRTYVFPVPEWDLPSRPVVEIDGDPYLRFSFPVYVDVS